MGFISYSYYLLEDGSTYLFVCYPGQRRRYFRNIYTLGPYLPNRRYLPTYLLDRS